MTRYKLNIITAILLLTISSGCALHTKRLRTSHFLESELIQIKESIDNGNFSQAISDLSMLLELDPRNKEALFLRALAYQKRTLFEKAVRDYKTLLKYYPNESKAHYNLGMIYAFKTYNSRGALKHFDQFLTLEPRNPKVHKIAQIMCSIQTRVETPQARGTVTQRINEYYTKRGIKSVANEKSIKVKREKLLKLVQLDPQSYEAYFLLARTYEDENRYSEAIKYYQMALEIKPTWAEAHRRIGQLLRRMDKPKEAEVHLVKASLFDPQS